MNRSTCQTVDQPAVHRAKRKLTASRARPRPWNVIECPGYLGSGKVGVRDEARLAAKHSLETLLLKPLAYRRCPAALPDDGIVNRQSRPSFPDYRSLALVGDPDGGYSLSR